MTHVVLLGLMGSGKSTVGRLVAERTRRTLVDVDVAIARRTGKSVRQLWEEGGEAAYRRLESAEVLAALRGGVPTVVAAPGGVVLDPEARDALADAEHALIVWLRTDPATLAQRVRPGDHRPLLGVRPYNDLAAMAADRSRLYEGLADAVVDTDAVDAPAAAAAVIDRLSRLPRGA